MILLKLFNEIETATMNSVGHGKLTKINVFIKWWTWSYNLSLSLFAWSINNRVGVQKSDPKSGHYRVKRPKCPNGAQNTFCGINQLWTLLLLTQMEVFDSVMYFKQITLSKFRSKSYKILVNRMVKLNKNIENLDEFGCLTF